MAAPDAPEVNSGLDIQALPWRAFGRAADLEVDFLGPDRPALVTGLLARCLSDRPLPEAEILTSGMTLAGRIGGLAMVVRATFETESLSVQPRCPDCGEGFEVDLPLYDLIGMARSAELEPVVRADLGESQPLLIRRPTGDDQKCWRASSYSGVDEAKAAILESLILSGPETHVSALLPKIADIMEQEDPVAAFRIACDCPHCNHRSDYPLDLEAHLLARLESRARALTREIHRFASRYGWTERDVMEVPPSRRAAYLRLMDQEAGLP